MCLPKAAFVFSCRATYWLWFPICHLTCLHHVSTCEQKNKTKQKTKQQTVFTLYKQMQRWMMRWYEMHVSVFVFVCLLHKHASLAVLKCNLILEATVCLPLLFLSFYLWPLFFCVTCLSWNREYFYPSWVSKVENSVVLSYSPTAAHWLEQSIEGWKEKEETGVRLSMCRQGSIVGLTAEQTIVEDSQFHSTLLLCSSEECVGRIWKRTSVSWNVCKKKKNRFLAVFVLYSLF